MAGEGYDDFEADLAAAQEYFEEQHAEELALLEQQEDFGVQDEEPTVSTRSQATTEPATQGRRRLDFEDATADANDDIEVIDSAGTEVLAPLRREVPKKTYLSEPPADGSEYTCCTASNGRRVYIPCLSSLGGDDLDAEDTANADANSAAMSMPGLRSVEELRRELREEEERHMIDSANGLNAAATTDVRVSLAGTRLWTQKYKPRRFAQLLNDDRTTRSLMMLLKSKQRSGKKRSSSSMTKESADPDAEQKGPPIVLLCGPPGVGKTTLVGVVGEQLGYRVVEMNASDDRTAGAIEDALRTTQQSGTRTVHGDHRPPLLVLDEADGLTGSAVSNVLLRWKTQKRLTRPIVCIANDLHTSALRPIRPHCELLFLRRPATDRLITRIRDVCDRERVDVDLEVLYMLIDRSQGDLRTMLNALQWLSRQQRRGSERPRIAVDMLKKHPSIGCPDSSTSGVSLEMVADWLRPLKGRKVVLDERLAASTEYDRVLWTMFMNLYSLPFRDPALLHTCDALDAFCAADIVSVRPVGTATFIGTTAALLSTTHVCCERRPMVRKELVWYPATLRSNATAAGGAGGFLVSAVKRCLEAMSPPMLRAYHSNASAWIVDGFLQTLLHRVLGTRELIQKADVILHTNLRSNDLDAAWNAVVRTLGTYGLTFQHVQRSNDRADASNASSGFWMLDPPLDDSSVFRGFDSYRRAALGDRIDRSTVPGAALAADLQAFKARLGLPRQRIAQSIRESLARDAMYHRIGSLHRRSPASADQKAGSSPSKRSNAQPAAAAPKKSVVAASAAKKPRFSFRKYFRSESADSDSGEKENSAAAVVATSELPEIGRRVRVKAYKFHEGFTNAVRRPVFLHKFMQ